MQHSDDEDVIPEHTGKHFHFGYDADTSNSSIDCSLSNDETFSDSRQRDLSEHFVRKSNNNPFVPISEETVFLNSSPMSSILTSSPPSIDSWTLYSNSNSMSSSDEYSLSDHMNSSSSSSDCPSAIEMHSRKKKFRNHNFESDEYLSLDSLPSSSHFAIEKSTVNVRIIDFAHASFVKKSDDCFKPVHKGPDGGFLTGLDSLKRLLHQIIEKS